MFIGREKELAYLEKAYSGESFRLVLIHGGKNTGKTTLLEEFCRNKSAIYFTASDGSNLANMNEFSAKVIKFYALNEYAPFRFWDDALSYIARAQENYRLVLVIDGFDKLAERDPAFIQVVANSVANTMRHSSVFLAIICEKPEILKKSPLIRYITGSIKLGKFLTDENVARLKSQALTQAGGLQQAKFVRVPEDRVILREGERNSDMYKIVSGRALCFVNYGTDDEYLLGSLKEGKTFGEYSLLTGKPGIYTVTAYTDMLLMRIGRGDFTKFIETNAGNSVNIMQNMAAMMNVMKVNIDMLNGELHAQN
ncbi:MAG: cyclic nucleotide-binding domain-containing protein [Synergistaceae bacterium]|nr:cyclic nucleotide-binding domain-containing protein [Synergistaceae bacterium]MBQ7168696.1 cyclic nucleotide-binding domain-containing protein [Synergistaceae bacterium]